LDWKGTTRFEIVRLIGRGGMGAVYEARDRERKQRVAVKTLLHFDPAALYLFKQEFRTLAGVHHPNLVRLHELVAGDADRVFFSMELVRGSDFLAYVQKPGTLHVTDGPSGVTSKEVLAHILQESGVHQAAADGSAGNVRVRTMSPVDIDRLRPALRQLVEGVNALHSNRKLHRDIKPSNVLVTPEGRVVLLDFGVATEVPRVADENLREEGQLVGTARYMAPEQAFEDAPTPAADWYSVGVVLYEALVGAPPFSGPILDVIKLKSSLDAPPPSQCVDGVPRDLDELCCALLDRAPDKRPDGGEILRRLGGARISIAAPPPLVQSTDPAGLIGRERHFRALREAFGVARGGRAVTVRVHGRAGMGKSVLMEHMVDDLVQQGEAVVLRGRAYERESVPYKAVDSVIDALSRHLMHVNDLEGTIVVPRDMRALARLFPVLRRVPGIGEIGDEAVADPLSVRRRAFAALRELLFGLATRRPMVIYIDDVQWGDTDSAALLLDLVRPPYSPPVMLVLAYREEDAQTAEFLTEVNSRWPLGADVRDIDVGPLEAQEARRLALRILGAQDATASKTADAIGRESGGSPFLVEELARSVAGKLSVAHDAKITLQQMVAERLACLTDEARRLVEIVALGGRPLPVSTVGDAAQVEATDEIIALLERRHFVRPGLRNGRETVEPVHDRIRETIVAQLSADSTRKHHGELARALQATPGADPESVALHLIGAGEAERGALFAERAAEQAAKQLAFDQAVRLFRLTIDSLPAGSPKLRPTRTRLAEVLGWTGRSEEAGRAYLVAAEGAPPLERVDLERAGSEQLLAAGRIEEGGLVLRRVLANAGIQAPATPLTAILSLLLNKLRLKLFGLAFEERDADAVLPEDRARLAALNVAALGLSSVDNVLAACMQARQLLEALRKGDRTQVLRSAVIYGIHLATRGGAIGRHERAVHDLIARLTAQSNSPLDVAYSRGTQGVGLFLRGRWREAKETIDKAYADLPKRVAGWQTQASLYAVYALVFMGDLVELRIRHARMLADADLRGDLFTSVQLRASHPTILALAADDPDAARRQTREASQQWTQNKFLIQHWQVMRSEVEIELYAGDGAKAYERLERDEGALKKSLLLTVQFMRALTTFARGRAAVASIGTAPERKGARLAEARRLARRLEREDMSWTAPLAALVTASAANASGDRPAARASLERAIALAQAADMALYAAAARFQLGRSLGRTEGAKLVERADDDMRAQAIQMPARFAAMLVPGTFES
jgi:serine/threonine protein kinase